MISSVTTADAMASTMQADRMQANRPPPPPGPPPGGGAPPSHEEAIETLGASLSDEVRAEMLETVETMQAEGASDEEIRSYVVDTLEDNGITLPEKPTGVFIDQQA